ncbi:hypothetical protein H257_00378 [Aphanomyces astaci]|uniref:Serine/threonine-protein phosphatase n=1 Tax=Aphanomyces astaci TaxID=112090 RepID=W4HCB8_APHAT|nr:hypothetical protein H257_00378 [Aphanomyces astaci]ETV88939.1 hypothetical protein H257_00378 [Aphanomyces astaci]|eukprot:XP_009821339.1 hypothetical protein H257_00378 [Aphanomyces astaci]
MDTKREIGPTLVLSPAKQSSLRSPMARRPVSPRPAAAAVATSTSETISFLSSGALQCSSQCGHQQALQLLEIKRLRDQLAELHLLHGEPKEKVKIPRAVTPAVFSVTDEGTKARSITTSMGRHVSIATGHVLRSIPKQVPNRVAERVSEAFVNPLKAIQYLNSYEFSTDLLAIANQVSVLFQNEPRCVPVQSPVYVIGDIHGNLSDLKFFSDHLWRLGIGLTAGNFLFLGDYVDRGLSSLECIAYLFAQKIMFPNKVVLLRGNHETRAVNGWEEHYGSGSFLAQCKKRFGNDEGCNVWHQVNNAFDCMPVSAVIDDDIFCAHGGIPRPLASGEKQLDSIQSIPRLASFDTLEKASNTPSMGEHAALLHMAEEMLWADPAGEAQEMTLDKHGFGKSARGGNSICFGNVAIDDFLQRHNFSYIIRAHEACSQGIHLSKSARVLTVFSTSKDHGLGKRAKCGCLLVERDRILILNRSHKYNGGFVRRRSSLQLSSSLLPQPDGGLSSTSAAARRCSAASSGGEHANEDDHEDEDSTDDEVDDTKALDGPTGIMANSQVVIDLGDNNQEET